MNEKPREPEETPHLAEPAAPSMSRSGEEPGTPDRQSRPASPDSVDDEDESAPIELPAVESITVEPSPEESTPIADDVQLAADTAEQGPNRGADRTTSKGEGALGSGPDESIGLSADDGEEVPEPAKRVTTVPEDHAASSGTANDASTGEPSENQPVDPTVDEAPDTHGGDVPAADTSEGGPDEPTPPADDEGLDGRRPGSEGEHRPHGEAGHVEGRHLSEPEPDLSGWAALRDTLRPTRSWSTIVTGVLCAVLGFVLVAEFIQPKDSNIASLRDSDLVGLLDKATQQSRELQDEIDKLTATRDGLEAGVDKRAEAQAQATKQAEVQGILSGRLPAEGPGILIDIQPGDTPLTAFSQFNTLEELRNAGAEAIEVNGVRLVTDSYFVDTSNGIEVDGTVLRTPYRWKAIGDPSTMETALEIPGGAMATVRAKGATATITQAKLVKITSTRTPETPQYATPVPTSGK